MRISALVHRIGQDLARSAKTLTLSAVGIAVGIATLGFFVALGAGVRGVVLGRIFPIDRIDVAPVRDTAGAILGMLTGNAPSGIDESIVRRLRGTEGVRAVHGRMRLVFPSSGRGGREVFGRNIGTGELPVEGIDPAIVRGDIRGDVPFEDPGEGTGTVVCGSDAECSGGTYCDMDLASDGHALLPGHCAPPVPGLVSPYLVEVFDGVIAPAHRLPPVGTLLMRSTRGMVLEWDLGRAGLGQARQGRQRRQHVRIVGVSAFAMDLGITVPIAVARRLDREFAGDAAAERYTSASVYLAHPSYTASVTAAIQAAGLDVKTTGAEQMGLLVTLITAMLSLTSIVVVLIASLNIAQVFLTQVAERKGEIALMRALGATAWDIRAMVIGQAVCLGVGAAVAGLLLSRLAAWGVDRAAARFLPPFPFKPEHWFEFDARTMAGVALFGIVASALCALLPASRAAKVQPAQALASGV